MNAAPIEEASLAPSPGIPDFGELSRAGEGRGEGTSTNPKGLSLSATPSPDAASKAVYTPRELRRVGIAATMIYVCGFFIIALLSMAMGHYNSLAHSGPKAVLDGAVIALLIGRQGRWRCLTLLGAVYGLALLIFPGYIYLLPVTALAAVVAAAAGRLISVVHRLPALVLAAIVYEILAGFGAPIQIYFGTNGRSEPFLWGMWFAEWPLRVIGASMGVWLALRWQARRVAEPRGFDVVSTDSSRPVSSHGHSHRPIKRNAGSLRRTTGAWAAGARLALCAVACTAPMGIQSPYILAGIAAAYIAYALWAGLRWRIVQTMLGLITGWIVFGALSYAWHRDLDRVIDLYRTLVLRFTPLMMASVVLVSTVRPVHLVRLLRKLRVSSAVLIPMSSVVRSIPQSRRMFRESLETMRAQGIWTGPMSFFRRPMTVLRGVLGPQVKRWATELAEEEAGLRPRR